MSPISAKIALISSLLLALDLGLSQAGPDRDRAKLDQKTKAALRLVLRDAQREVGMQSKGGDYRYLAATRYIEVVFGKISHIFTVHGSHVATRRTKYPSEGAMG